MPPDLRNPTDPAEWLRRARSNLTQAKAGRAFSGVLYEDLCFDAQQAVEKAIKAVLVQRAIAFPKTHAIMDLLTLLQQSGLEIPYEIREAGILTRYAVETRYPGLSEPLSETDYDRAVGLAERVVPWCEALIAAGGKSPA